MSNNAGVWLDNFYLGATHKDIDPSLMAICRPSDKHVMSAKYHQLPAHSQQWAYDYHEEDNLDSVYYSTPINIIRDRLDLLGYTFETARLGFERYIDYEIAHQERNINRFDFETHPLAILRDLDVDTWLTALHCIYKENLNMPEVRLKFLQENDNKLYNYMFQQDWLGCPGPDLCVPLRLAIEAIPESENFVYDVSDFVRADYFDESTDFVKYALEDTFFGDFDRKVIVLTEGSTDSWILSESLALLYPHLAKYFTFMDFNSSRVSGGVGGLANTVKAFSGAGILNRVIALFDNDTAAMAAMRGLRNVRIPSNIVIRMLPNIPLLNDYPTLGPSGLVNMDVNGMAGGIELYLGKDVLLDRSGNLNPVQWTGFNAGIKKYQGEVLNKDEVQKMFRKKLNRCKTNQSSIEEENWSSVIAVLETLFSAFHEYDQHRILAWEDEILSINGSD